MLDVYALLFVYPRKPDPMYAIAYVRYVYQTYASSILHYVANLFVRVVHEMYRTTGECRDGHVET